MRQYLDTRNLKAKVSANREKAHYTVQDAMDIAYLTGQRPSDVLGIMRNDTREGALWFTQSKTGEKLRITIEGELELVVNRIFARPRKVTGLWLIQDDNGQPLSYTTFRSRINKARKAAKVNFQFRDIRAKAATDTENLAHAQKLLGHKTRAMTEHYTRNRKVEKVSPLR